ncbi:tetratricopeptide repeat protein [Dactylosporangium sp. NPDC049525]|uniref:tetratricopeptide repeat protein n=1 Tax=Dactylosporangium sp. NPDC049525 TaxID=3154730 RepID=UPI00344915D2
MSASDDQLRASVRQGWQAARRADPAPTVRYFEELLAQHPDSAFARYQCARAHDFAGEPHLAAPLYEQAFAAGLPRAELRRGLTSYGSTLRNLERFDEAVTVLERAHSLFPDDVLILCYLALALHSAGQPARALACLLDLIMARVDDPDLHANRWALGNYAAALIHGTWSPDGAKSLELLGPLLDSTSADQTASTRSN